MSDATESGQERDQEPTGPIVGRCSECGRFVADWAIICNDCDVIERRREFEGTLP